MSTRKQEAIELTIEIKKSFEDSKEIYGSPHVHQDLISSGFCVSRKRVARLMKEEGLQSKTMFAKDTTIAALKMANMNRNITEPLLFHSVSGIQYACKEFTNHLKANP